MQTSLTPEEVTRRGDALYQDAIRSQVEAQHPGEFVLIDIDSGAYEVDADDMAAEARLYARRPNGVMYLLRIGAPAAYTIGTSL